jgi:hypothetical protein
MTKQTPAVFDRVGKFRPLDDVAIAALDPEQATIYRDLAAAAKLVEDAEVAVTQAQAEAAEAAKALRAAQTQADTKPRLSHDDLVRTDLIGDKLAVKRVIAQGKLS